MLVIGKYRDRVRVRGKNRDRARVRARSLTCVRDDKTNHVLKWDSVKREARHRITYIRARITITNTALISELEQT